MEARGNVIVIAATNRVNSIDEALRRPGRFDREIEFPVPDKNGRKEVLQIHSRGMPLAKDVDLEYFAGICHGFVGADLAALAKEAAMKALRRYLPKINLEEETIPAEVLEALEVNKKDFMEALKDVQPSALREVTIEIPNVKWQDVGALEAGKQELKQAVEWPLKHPESFKRLGIKPPRGILLYGPPGCGKTLLAKAVATESEANFISIKGPELISMWVGESLPFDEELLVFDGKSIFREKIGIIVEQKEKLQVVTFDNDGKVFFAKITDFIKHSLNGKMLQVTTKTGRKIKVTDKHSLFSLVENEIEPVVPSQLVEGKSVVAVPAKIPNISFGEKHLNLFELFKGSKDFFIESQQVSLLIKKIGYKKAQTITGLKTKYLYAVARKGLPISLKNFSSLLEHAKEKASLENAFVFRKGARNVLPAMVSLSEELFELIGLWVAEGDINQSVPRISILDEEILERAKKILNGLRIKYSVFEKRGIVINSTTLASVFESFGLKSGSFNKRIPNNLLVAPNNLVFSFLRGYFSGDGTIRDNGHSCMIEATTVSEQLANDLLYLLLKLGIVANYAQKKEWTGSISHRIQIFGAENFKRFALAGFIDSVRNSKIQEYVNKVSWQRSNLIPISQKIEALLNEAFVSYPSNQTVGKGKIREALCLVDLNKQKFPGLWKLVDADIFWDKVEKIEDVSYGGAVYDISVEPCQNFVAGFGGLFAHNSEKGIRRVFKKARQVSPVIVFFDEIDSIASHRGSTTDSGVGERVVNQLLTELDGIESLKDVVFIAATNRPDLIDPGLLRPGRIDKLIRVNAPDEKARLAIFKVHSKGVPLAKDVSLEELANKTDGFSGADIEGLIRESALIALQESNMKANTVEKKHVDAALQKVMPSISKETEEAYDEFREKVGTFKPSYIE
jgi:SpoVK/Ycf46/Vps4 family AAA+-type ATPase/intein/homing endonuclease